MKTKLTILGILLAVILVGSLLAGLLVLLAAGLGGILGRFLAFTPFEITLLSLIALAAVGMLILNFLRMPVTLPSPDAEESDAVEDEEEELDGALEEPLVVYMPGYPRGKAGKPRDIPVVAPDARCPCGSGRKYKNCHGRVRAGGEQG